MALYDRYKLTNSTQIPEYAGSTLNEMTKVADVLQSRYDQARAYDDYLAEQDKYAKVHAKDRALYNETMQGYRDRIRERASSGNFEDMVRATAQDARGFGRDYADFADNLQRRTAYASELDKVRKDLNLSADDINKLQKLSEYNTKGMTRDPQTGQMVGKFQGITPEKSIDVAAWTDEKLKGIIAKEIGSDVTSITGIKGLSENGEQYYVQQGSKTVTVPAKRIQAILSQAMKLDPEFQGSVRQRAMLDTIGLDKATPDNITDPAMRASIQELADKSGVSFGQAAQRMAQNRIVNDITTGALNYGVLKREQNDRTTRYDIKGETEATGRREKDKESNNFGINISIPKDGSDFNSPDKITEGITKARDNVKQIDEQYTDWIKSNNVSKTGDNYYMTDANGRRLDVTDRVVQFRMLREQEAKQADMLNRLEKESMNEAGFVITPQLRAKAETAKKMAVEATNSQANEAPTGVGIGLGVLPNRKSAQEEGQAAYDRVLRQSPRYKEYQEILKNKASNITMSTIATRFQKKSDNDAVEKLVNNITTNDFKSNMLSMEYVGTEKGGKQLTPDDYEAMKGDMKFAGQYIDDKGQQAYIFTAEDPKTKEKRQVQVRGIVSNVPTPKLTGEDMRQSYAQQLLRSATANPNKFSEITLNDGTKLELRTPTGAGGDYNLKIYQGGQGVERVYSNEGSLTEAIRNIFKRNAE